MRIHAFDWDEGNASHIAKHDVTTEEVEEVILFSKPVYQKTRNDRYIAYGATEGGRHLLIVFAVIDKEKIRVIAARVMAEKERRYYKKRKGVR